MLSFLFPYPCRGEWDSTHTNQMWGGVVKKILLRASFVSADQGLILGAVN